MHGGSGSGFSDSPGGTRHRSCCTRPWLSGLRPGQAFSAFPARRSGRQSAGSAGPRRQFPVTQAGIKGNLPRFQIGPGAGLLALRYALRCVSAIAFPPDQRACSACAASATSLLPIFTGHTLNTSIIVRREWACSESDWEAEDDSSTSAALFCVTPSIWLTAMLT